MEKCCTMDSYPIHQYKCWHKTQDLNQLPRFELFCISMAIATKVYGTYCEDCLLIEAIVNMLFIQWG